MATAIIPCIIDKDFDSPDQWRAQTPTGLFASGVGFKGAREALAMLIIEEGKAKAEACALEGEGDIDAVRLMAVTRKTFKVGG